jgi:hypothetical protein
VSHRNIEGANGRIFDHEREPLALGDGAHALERFALSGLRATPGRTSPPGELATRLGKTNKPSDHFREAAVSPLELVQLVYPGCNTGARHGGLLSSGPAL